MTLSCYSRIWISVNIELVTDQIDWPSSNITGYNHKYHWLLPQISLATIQKITGYDPKYHWLRAHISLATTPNITQLRPQISLATTPNITDYDPWYSALQWTHYRNISGYCLGKLGCYLEIPGSSAARSKPSKNKTISPVLVIWPEVVFSNSHTQKPKKKFSRRYFKINEPSGTVYVPPPPL